MLDPYSLPKMRNHLVKDVEVIMPEYVLLSSVYPSGDLHASVLFPCSNINFFQVIVSTLLIGLTNCCMHLRSEKSCFRSILEFPISRVYCINPLMPRKQLEAILKSCSSKIKEFESIAIKNNQCIGDLFDNLKTFQLDSSYNKITEYIDEKARGEKQEKDSHLNSIDNFKKLEKKKKNSEVTYYNVFKDIAEVVLQDTEIEIDDGEMVSGATKRMAIINYYDNTEFGRRIDVFAHQTQYGHDIEYCGIEFKTGDASDALLKHQQSKNIRINATMLDDIIGITQDKHKSSTYMDWWGTSGYMVQLFKQDGYFVAHHITSLHIPCCLLELDDFRITLKYLYKWREQLIEQSSQIKIGLFQNKQKHETMAISAPAIPIATPNRSPSVLPADIFYRPSKRPKEIKMVGFHDTFFYLPMMIVYASFFIFLF